MPSRRGYLLSAAIALVFAAGCSSDSPPDRSTAAIPPVRPAAPVQMPADLRIIAPDLPPLPDLSGAAGPVQTVRAVFEFAARHPEVLRYIPCVCGCERGGHQANDMCFVASRDKTGHVTAWEPHGVICEVCIDIADDSMRMFNSGASVAAIRKAIETKYVVGGRTTTPTPRPPGRAGH